MKDKIKDKSKILKEFKTLEDLMFNNEPAKKTSQKKKFFKNKKYNNL